MAAYLVADIEITDPAAFEGYRNTVGESIAAFGGRYLARGGRTEIAEGDWTPRRLVILEFPTMERLKAWYDSPLYAPALALRKRSTNSNLVMVEGV